MSSTISAENPPTILSAISDTFSAVSVSGLKRVLSRVFSVILPRNISNGRRTSSPIAVLSARSAVKIIQPFFLPTFISLNFTSSERSAFFNADTSSEK